MNIDFKHRIVANVFAAIVFQILALLIIQLYGGWSVVERTGFFGGALIVGVCASVSYSVHTLVRVYLARRAGIKYLSPHARELKRLAGARKSRPNLPGS